jgi:signal transduction histidine kinase
VSRIADVQIQNHNGPPDFDCMPAIGSSMLPSHDASVIALICRLNGTVTQVMCDDVGLRPGPNFFSLIHETSLRKARSFFRAVGSNQSALDWELSVMLPDGIAPLFFSGWRTNRGIVIIGMKDPSNLSLARAERGDPGDLVPGLLEFDAEKRAPSHAREKSQAARQERLVRRVAHDLANSVSGILAASQFLIEDAAPSLDHQQVAVLQSIESSSGLLLRWIEDLLHSPLITSESPKLHFEATDVSKMVDQSTAIHRPLAQAKNTPIEVTKDIAIPRVFLDPMKMTQALNAILTNAVRSSKPGSKIEIAITTRPERTVIIIRHTGPGDSNQQPSLRRGRPPGRERTLSTFILASVRRIVEGHGGTVKLASGAHRETFTVTLPRVETRRVPSTIAVGHRPVVARKSRARS